MAFLAPRRTTTLTAPTAAATHQSSGVPSDGAAAAAATPNSPAGPRKDTGKISCWVKGDTYGDDEAFRVSVSADATVGDILLQGFSLFRLGKQGGLRPSDMEVTLAEKVLSNRELLGNVLPKKKGKVVYDSSGRQEIQREPYNEIFVLRRKYKYKYVQQRREENPAEAATGDPNSKKKGDSHHNSIGSSARGTNPTRRDTTPQRTITPKRLFQTVRPTVSSNARKSFGEQRQGDSSSSSTPVRRGRTSSAGGSSRGTNTAPAPAAAAAKRNGLLRSSANGAALYGKTPADAAAVGDCVFLPLWDDPMCGRCGRSKELHKKFPESAAEKREKIIQELKERRAAESPLMARTGCGLWESPQRQGSVSPIRGRRCQMFQPAWGRPHMCELCNCPLLGHDNVSNPDVYLHPTKSKAPRRPPPPTVRHLRGVCHNFLPLWNHNGYCDNCYHPIDAHDARSLPSYYQRPKTPGRDHSSSSLLADKKRKVGKQTARAGLLLCTLPWDVILPFCTVADLAKVGQTCRLLTMNVRPLLESTMIQVAQLELHGERDELWRQAVHVAENLAPYSDAARHMLVACLTICDPELESKGMEDVEAQIGNFHFRLALIKEVAGLHPLSLTPDALSLFTELENYHIEPGHDLFPLLAYFRSLWLQYSLRTKAMSYIQHEKVFL